MALEIVTGFEIEAPLLPACVTSSSSLNLRFFNTKNGNDPHDKVGAKGVVVRPVCLSPSGHSEQVRPVWPQQSSSLESGWGQLSAWFRNTARATQGYGLTSCLLGPPAPTTSP